MYLNHKLNDLKIILLYFKMTFFELKLLKCMITYIFPLKQYYFPSTYHINVSRKANSFNDKKIKDS